VPLIKGMVKKKAICFAALSCLLVSCSMITGFEIPESVTLVTKATYSVPLGKAKGLLSDHINAQKLHDIIDGNATSAADHDDYKGVEIYDYNKNQDNIQRYIVNYPVADIPLDMSEYFSKLDDLDLSKGSTNSFSQEFATQDLSSLDFSQDVDIDFKSIFDEKIQINNSAIPEIPVVEPGTAEAQELVLPMPGEYIDFRFTSPSFTGVTFKEGGIVFSVTVSSGTPTMEMNVKAVLYDGSNKKIAESDSVNIASGGNLTIDLAGKTIPASMRFQFVGDFSGGTALNPLKYQTSLSLTSGYKISRISGLTIPKEDLAGYAMNVDKTISTAELQAYLKTATISQGSLNYKVEIPSTWSGIKSEPQLSVSGGLEIDSSEFKNSSGSGAYITNKTVNLKGKTILPQDIRINGSIPFELDNATVTIDYDESGNVVDKVGFSSTAEITELSNAQIYMNDLIDSAKMSKTISQPLAGEVVDYVKAVSFNKVGLSGQITTDLPSNDMKLTSSINSTFFDITDLSGSVSFKDKAPYKIDLEKDYVEEDGAAKEISLLGGPTIDFTVDMALAGSNETEPGLVTFSSIKPGQTYNFNFDISFVFDWVDVLLNTKKCSYNGEFESGFSLDSMFEDAIDDQEKVKDILNKIKFYDDAFEGFFCVTRPDLAVLDDFTDANVSTLKLEYDGVNENLFTGSLNFVSAAKSLAELADENLVITDISGIETSGKFNGPVLVKMLNDKPDVVKFKYNLDIGGEEKELRVKREDVEKMKKAGHTTSIKASILLILSLRFYISDDIVIDDVMGMFGAPIENDLLGRESAGDEASSKEYADLVKAVRLEYLFKNNSGFEMQIKMNCNDEGGTSYLTKDIDLSPDNVSWEKDRKKLEFKKADIDSFYSNYPFKPVFSVVIPKTETENIPISIQRNANVTLQAVLSAETDGDYKIWGGDD